MNEALATKKPPGFWESRTGSGQLKEVLLLELLPGGARWAAAFGSLLLFAFLLQVVTGILLSMNYAPSEKTAYASVKFIQEEVSFGAYVRSVHHWGSSAMVILLLLHLVQVFVWGAYKRPREFTWMIGVLLMVGTLGLAFTGYLLPWDQKAYWATKVGLGILGTVPAIGDDLRTVLQGGPEIGNLTLTRFFTLHGFVLPGLIFLLAFVHLYLFRLHGVTPGWWQSESELKAQAQPFWPYQAWKDGVVAFVFILALGTWCYFHAAPLEAQADPSQAFDARPEWYFMFLFQLLRYFHGPYEIVGTFVLPTVFFLVLFFWPFLDRNPERNPRRRPIAMTLLTTATVGLVGMTIFAMVTDVRMHEPELASKKEEPKEKAGPIQRLEVAKLYGDYCLACHGVDGSGKQLRANMPTIPDFTSLAWQMSRADLEIVHRIRDGNEPLMPAFRDKLDSTQNLALAIYVRAFAIELTGQSQPKVATVPKEIQPKGIPSSEKTAPTTAPSNMAVVQIYRSYCLACHDSDGRGMTARKAMPEIPDFTDSKWQLAKTNPELLHSMMEGKGKFMLPMKDKLNSSDAELVLTYIRNFKEGKQVVKVEPRETILPPAPSKSVSAPTPAPTISAARAQTAVDDSAAREETSARIRVASVNFRQYCLNCHGVDGRGTEMKIAMPAIPDFKLNTWQDSHTNPQLVASILDGKGTLMPAFRGRMDEAQTKDIVAYIRAFNPSVTPPTSAPTSGFEGRFHQLQQEWETLQKQLKEIPPNKDKK